MYYIYGLVDPIDNEIKYIGQTISPKKRYETHLRPISLKEKWIHDLKIVGKKPTLKIIGRATTVQGAIQKEQRMILFYRRKGANLFNGKFCSCDDLIKSDNNETSKRKIVYSIETIGGNNVIADNLKNKYEIERYNDNFSEMDEIIYKLYYLGWIPAVRTSIRTVWARIK